MNQTVIVLGGGVAGMTAAHELAERGYSVTVYEHKQVAGGKARSVDVPNSATEGRKSLPGEHGFRYIPRFYRHVPDTLKRIPYAGNSNGVYDNLVDTTRLEWVSDGQAPFLTITRFPRSVDDLEVLVRECTHGIPDLEPGEFGYFSARIWQVLTSCRSRRFDEYERIGWWDFIGAASRSAAYKKYLAVGMTRSLVASQAKLANARTLGDILIQLMFDVIEPGASTDRVLNGPTNDVWINPWLEHLRSLGVDYQFGCNVTGINVENGKVSSATISRNGGPEETVTGDYFIAAVPIEVMTTLITPDLLAIDPTLAGIQILAPQTAWMNGIQFYVTEPLALPHGHQLYLDSLWAITSLSQGQFWDSTNLAEYGDGTVRDILSVDISDFNTPGLNGKAAIDCTREEIADETWKQLKLALNFETEILRDDHLHSWFLDADITSGNYTGHTERNLEPLLLNLIKSWVHRPTAHTLVPNLFLAADYIRTNTDLATMEGASEAARRAVNSLLDASGSSASFCTIWDLHEPDILWPWRKHDQTRYDAGLPWDGKIFG